MALQVTTSSTYDIYGNVLTKTDEVGAVNLITDRRRDGQVITNGYDVRNNRTSGARSAALAYDNLDRLVGFAVPSLSYSRSYDALSRMVGETGAQGTVNFSNDGAGRRTGLTWPDGFGVAYWRSNLGETFWLADSAGNGLNTYGYDNLGRRYRSGAGTPPATPTITTATSGCRR